MAAHAPVTRPSLPRCDGGAVFWAQLTPPGPAALASFGVRGSGATSLLERIFVPSGRRRLTHLAPGDVVFGRVGLEGNLWEEAVLGYWAPDEWELHTHGGPAVTHAVIRRLQSEGAQELAPKEWTRSGFEDPIAADALAALAQARSDRTAQILLDQYRGALTRELAQLARRCHQGDPAALEELAVLRGRWTLGRHLTSPWRVVLAGRPNAGKSSLLNALAGYERAIVFPEPGTTRDLVTCSTAIDGWPVELTDMAGLRTAADTLEAAGIARARRALATADVVLLVVDGTLGWDDDLWAEVAPQSASPGKQPPRAETNLAHCVVVYNKADLPGRTSPSDPPGVAVSARTGQGLESLLTAISQRLVPVPPPSGTAVPFTEAQAEALAEAETCLKAGDAAQAAWRLERLLQTGQ